MTLETPEKPIWENCPAGSLKSALLSILPTGKENAVGGKHLSRRLIGEDTRAIRQTIFDLAIEDNILVCCSEKTPRGYYLPKDRQEAQDYLDVLLHNHALPVLRHYKYARIAQGKMFPQIKML